jgi:hypothetical protein
MLYYIVLLYFILTLYILLSFNYLNMLWLEFDMCYSVHVHNLSNFIANKCTSLTLLLYVALQSRRHVSIRDGPHGSKHVGEIVK